MLVTTVVDFLRHGEAQGGSLFRGRTDDPLSEVGWQQMLKQCETRQWDTVLSSPLSRCLDFADYWSRQRACRLHIDPGWKEIDFGDWDGLTAEQIDHAYPAALQAFYADPCRYTPPNAESYTAFSARIEQAWESAVSQFAGQRLLVVTHAGVIRALLSLLFSIPYRHSLRIDVPHACLTRFSCFQETDNRFVQLNFHKPV